MKFRFLEKFQATLDKLFSVAKDIELKEISWREPADARDALLMLFDIQGDFQKPDGTQHPQPVRYIRHKRRAGSPYRRKQEVCT